MNSSSAYSNVLLATPTKQQSAPKRDFQDDQASDAFQQTFKDVHEARHNEKVNKPASTKKSVVADKPVAEPASEKNVSVPVRQSDKCDSCESVGKSDTSDQDQVNSKSIFDVDQTTNVNAEKDDASDLDLDSAQPVNQDQLLANPLLASNALTAPIESAITPLFAAPAVSIATDSDPSNTSIVNAELVDTSLADENNSELNGLSESESSKTQATKSEINQLLTTDTNISLDSIRPTVDATVLAQSTDTSAGPAAQQADALLASGMPLGNTTSKPLAAQLPLSVDDASTTENSDLFAIAGLVDSESTASKIAIKSQVPATNKVGGETELVSNQFLDSKTTFEKTMQNLGRAETGSSDQTASLPAANQTSPTSSPNTLDSLFRLSDAQTPATRSFVVQTAVPVPVGQPQWSQAVGEKVLWLAAQNVTSAEIHLHPKDLGPMQVNVSVNQDQASVSFTSHHAVVRDVLDQNMNRLRDMFSEQGLNLVNVDVSDKSFRQQQGEAKDQHGQPLSKDASPEDDPAVAVSAIIQQRLVDHYA